jgi:hypothetical protein
MTIEFVGTTFQSNHIWWRDENKLIENIILQINKTFSDEKNLLINTTWFGPQFTNGQYQKFLKIVDSKKFDNIFWLASVDPAYLDNQVLNELSLKAGAKNHYYLGNFEGQYSFNFISTLLPKYFKKYEDSEILLEKADHVYLNYNRKPRVHRVELAQKLVSAGLRECGILTLGKNDKVYSLLDDNPLQFNLGESPNDSLGDKSMQFGIPNDIHSLGNLEIWQKHFLTVISETEFPSFKSVFITEKTWKSILGLRPFLINGQTKIYSWLRQQGFKTFENYWPHIDCENISDHQICDQIVSVIDYLNKLPRTQLEEMYRDMLPDLLYNRDRFYSFVNEQQYKINHLFEPVDNK